MDEKAPPKNGDLLKPNADAEFYFAYPLDDCEGIKNSKRPKLMGSLSNESGKSNTDLPESASCGISHGIEKVLHRNSDTSCSSNPVLRENFCGLISPSHCLTSSSYNPNSPSYRSVLLSYDSASPPYTPTTAQYAPTSPKRAAPTSPSYSPLAPSYRDCAQSSQSTVFRENLYTSNLPNGSSNSPLLHGCQPSSHGPGYIDAEEQDSNVNIIPNDGEESSSSGRNTVPEIKSVSSTDCSTENEVSLSGVPHTNSTEAALEEVNQFKDDLNDVEFFKQNAEWQDAKIRYLESKLRERHYFKLEYEASQTTIRTLQNNFALLRQKAANVEMLEAQSKRQRDEIKILEEDKRSKNELGNTISNLIDETTALKTEIKNLTSIAGMLEKENSNLKQKYEEMERQQQNQKVNDQKIVTGCSGKDANNEVCCYAVQNIITMVTELLESELKCSICEEIFVNATVTNCNHMYCSYCLKEWKKKKNECPFCRAKITKEFRATAVDEYITSLLKLISSKMYAERIQTINERKAAAAVPPKKTSYARPRVSYTATFPHATVSSIISGMPITSPGPPMSMIPPIPSYNTATDLSIRTLGQSVPPRNYVRPSMAEMNSVTDNSDDWKKTEFRRRNVTMIARAMARRGYPHGKAVFSVTIWEQQIFSKSKSKDGYLAALNRLPVQCLKLVNRNHLSNLELSMGHIGAMSSATLSTDGVSSTTAQII